MPRYVALLRGVSPMNCKMPDLQRSLEDAGFTAVKTLLSSGNVAFSTPRAASAATLQKRVVAFLRELLAASPVALPLAHGEACILGLDGGEVFCSYVPEAKGPVFMQLLEKAFGKGITTRTWETVARCANA